MLSSIIERIEEKKKKEEKVGRFNKQGFIPIRSTS